MMLEWMQKAARAYGLKLSTEQMTQLAAYSEALLKRNETVNLTAIREPETFIVKNVVDAVRCDLSGYAAGTKVLDVGTGGGFPGIPLAIVNPECDFVLLDSTKKKIDIVRELATATGIGNVTCIDGRAEVLAKDLAYREQFDIVVSRAVADLRILMELCVPFIKVRGAMIAWKGSKAREEVANAAEAMRRLQCVVDREITYKIRDAARELEETHVILKIRKNKRTPERYPRQFGVIKKKPL